MRITFTKDEKTQQEIKEKVLDTLTQYLKKENVVDDHGNLWAPLMTKEQVNEFYKLLDIHLPSSILDIVCNDLENNLIMMARYILGIRKTDE